MLLLFFFSNTWHRSLDQHSHNNAIRCDAIEYNAMQCDSMRSDVMRCWWNDWTIKSTHPHQKWWKRSVSFKSTKIIHARKSTAQILIPTIKSYRQFYPMVNYGIARKLQKMQNRPNHNQTEIWKVSDGPCQLERLVRFQIRSLERQVAATLLSLSM